jgi:flagellar assembly factor FliW
MKINTTRFGEIEVEDGKIITTFGGFIGFENQYRFVILEYLKDSQFKWIQSINEPGLAFVIADPWYFFKDYDFEISDEDQKEIEIEKPDDIVVLAIATIPEDIVNTTLNLLSPLVINIKKMIAKQIILYNSKYTTKHKIILKVQIDNGSKMEEIRINLQNRIKEKAVVL